MADIQVNFVGKDERQAQSHEIAKRLRPAIKAIGDRYGARVKIVEIPPGPPVLSTLVAEIYGPEFQRQREIAGTVKAIFQQTRTWWMWTGWWRMIRRSSFSMWTRRRRPTMESPPRRWPGRYRRF